MFILQTLLHCVCYREEEGEYDDEGASNRSNGEPSVNENNANDSHPPSIGRLSPVVLTPTLLVTTIDALGHF